MLIAPHPDDETLGCSVILQKAVRAGAAVRVVYITDGDDNPWPQRLIERKWRITAADRERWGKLRRTEALAALRVLDVDLAEVKFLALPDQKLTELLVCDCDAVLARIAAIIDDWRPTDLLAPSLFDTHPDHSAVAVMMRSVFSDFLDDASGISLWNYLVHGKSPAFFNRATSLPQSEVEVGAKREAIRCHQTQIKLSKRRFFGYAARPEHFVKVERRPAAVCDGSIRSVSRERETLCIDLELAVRPLRLREDTLLLFGRDASGKSRACSVHLPARSSDVEIFDHATCRQIGLACYRGSSFAGKLQVPGEPFSPDHELFVKLQRSSWFFDEAGWIEVPPALPQDRQLHLLDVVCADDLTATR